MMTKIQYPTRSRRRWNFHCCCCCWWYLLLVGVWLLTILSSCRASSSFRRTNDNGNHNDNHHQEPLNNNNNNMKKKTNPQSHQTFKEKTKRQISSSSSSSSSPAAGSSSSIKSPKIIGGEPAPKGQYPYMVALVDRSMELVCGASLIAPNVVLTASHCAYGILEYAVLGLHDLSDVIYQQPPNNIYQQQPSSSSPPPTTTSSQEDNNDTSIEIIKIQHEIMHPLYDNDNIRYDILILILERSSTKSVIAINHNSLVPSITSTTISNNNIGAGSGAGAGAGAGAGGDWNMSTPLQQSIVDDKQQQKQQGDNSGQLLPKDDSSTTIGEVKNGQTRTRPTSTNETYSEELTAIGFGHGSNSYVLHRTKLNYIPNSQCEQATDGFEAYSGLVFDDMMCTFAAGRDTCYGDSGGPLILTRRQHNNDNNMMSMMDKDNNNSNSNLIPILEEVQVGVTSWGFSCADPNFPGVSSRISESYDFIRQQVCTFTSDTKAVTDFNCTQLLQEYTSSPTQQPGPPTSSPAPTIQLQPCMILIVMDDWALEVGWKIKDMTTKQIVAEEVPGTYITEDEIIVPVQLIPGRDYRFTIWDTYGDGMIGLYTEYALILGTELTGERLVQGTGDSYTDRQVHSFSVPEITPAPITAAPSTGTPTTNMPTPTPTTAAPTALPTTWWTMTAAATGTVTTTTTTTTPQASPPVSGGVASLSFFSWGTIVGRLLLVVNTVMVVVSCSTLLL